MAQWAKFLQIKKFVNPTRLYITYGKSGGLHLAEPGLTAGRQAGRQAGSMSDKIWARYELAVDQNIRFSVLFNKHTENFDAFLVLFSGKHYYNVVL